MPSIHCPASSGNDRHVGVGGAVPLRLGAGARADDHRAVDAEVVEGAPSDAGVAQWVPVVGVAQVEVGVADDERVGADRFDAGVRDGVLAADEEGTASS